MVENTQRKLETIRTLNTDDETSQTFVIHDEDHTLGNSVRWMIAKNPDVEFCGYSVPHPSENKINLRIQTRGMPASDILRAGLSDLKSLCEHILVTFEKTVEAYQNH